MASTSFGEHRRITASNLSQSSFVFNQNLFKWCAVNCQVQRFTEAPPSLIDSMFFQFIEPYTQKKSLDPPPEGSVTPSAG